MKKNIETLICSGGGIKGIAYIGVMKALEELETQENTDNIVNIKKISCISVGSIFGLLYILGYKSGEIESEIMQINFIEFINIKLTNILDKYGIDSGKRIIKWLELLFEKKSIDKNITFEELFNNEKCKLNIDFQVMATNLNTYKLTVFNYKNHPKMKVLKAIRMAISLPFIFTAETYKKNIYIDGAIIDNFPIYLFENEIENVLGIKLVSYGEHHEYNNTIENMEDYITNILTCFSLQKDKNNILKQKYKNHTIFVHSNNLNQTINFNINNIMKQNLIESGYMATKKFFEE